MKQITFEKYGPPALVAHCSQGPEVSPPAAWEIIVEVEAFPINPADLAMLHGNYGWLAKPPSTIGMEAVGRVIEVGKSVQTLQCGDRVVILANNNWSQRRKIPATLAVKVPDSLCVWQAAMLKVNPLTAWKLVTANDQLQAGEYLVQNAPLSNVGRFVIQIAKLLGLKTINLVRSEEQKDTVLKLGGDHVYLDVAEIMVKRDDVTGGVPVRLALDGVAGDSTNRLAAWLSENGLIVNYGMMSHTPCVLSPEHTIFHNIRLTGFWLTRVLNHLSSQERTAAIQQLADWAVAGSIHGAIDSTFPIEQIQAAIRRAEEQGRRGKVLVYPNGKPE